MADEKKRDDDQAPSLAPQLATFAGVGTAVHLAKNKGEDRPLKAIRRAEEMRVKGAKRTEIHRETSKMLEGTPYAGVTYGADKQPRFEIDDSMASARVAGVPAGGKAFLTDTLHHPELYDAVPSTKHLTVERSKSNDSGITGSGIIVGDKHFGGRIGGREIMKKSAKGPMLHEIQHHVQDIEGFAEGGTPSDFAKQYPNNPDKQKLAYMTLAGEQEAEMTRKRADMTAAERRANMPQPEVPYSQQIVRFDARTKSKIDMTSISDSARAAYRALMNRDVADGKSIRFRKVDPSQVQSDAQTFQFKSGGDQAGVTDRLKGVKTWDPVAAGKTVIWERADGQMFIGDGHQRLGLAKRLQGAGQNVELDAYVMREKDGWSPRDVRAYAAVKNMKEGSGTSLDMAKVVRERPDLVNDSLPLSDAKVRDAISLSKLSPEAFNMVVGGVIKPEHAAAVGSAVGDTTRHAGLLAEMAKAEVASAQQARLYVGQAMAAGTYQETTGSLFGEETQVRSLLAERTKVLDKAIQSLKSDKKIFGLLEREAGQIEAAGNKLAHETNAARAEGAGRTAELVERLAMNRGPVSEMLDRAAAAVADGKTPSVAAREFVRSVHDTLKAGGMAGLTGDAPKPAPAPVDPNQVNMFGGSGERPGWSDAAREASAEVRADNAKGPKMKKPRAPKKTKAMMDSDLPPRLGKGRTSPAAAAKWERELRAVPQDAAEKRLLERKKGERIGQNTKPRAMADDDMFGGPSTKDKIAAAARAKEAKGRTGDPMDIGLFGSSKDQTDLVDMAKQQVKPRTVIAPDAHKYMKYAELHADGRMVLTGKGGQVLAERHGVSNAEFEQVLSDAGIRAAKPKTDKPPRAGKKAVDMAKIKDELRETFARDPNGKQRNTKGELLPERSVEGLRAGDMERLKRTIRSGTGETVSKRHADLLSQATNAQLSELDTVAHESRRGSARTDADFNRIGAFRQQIRDLARAQSDAAAKQMIEGKGPSGWSDAAREASAEVRAADAKPVVDPVKVIEKRNETALAHAEVAKSLKKSGQTKAAKSRAAVGLEMVGRNEKALAKPLMKDAEVKHLLKHGLVTREDVKTSPTMGALKDKARASAANMLRDRGMLDTGTKRDQVIEEWVNSGKPKTVDAKAYDMVKGSVKPTEKTTSEWQVGSGAKGKKTWHAYRTTKWVEDGTPRSVTEPLTGPSGKPRQFASKAAAEKATSGLRGTQAKSSAAPTYDSKKTVAKINAAKAVIKRYVTLGDGRKMPLGAYTEAWKKAKDLPPDAPVRGTPSDPTGGGTAADVLRQMRAGIDDRINSKDPNYGQGRKWDESWQSDARRLKDTLAMKSEVPAGQAHPVDLRPRLAAAGRLEEGTWLPPKGGERSKAKSRAKGAAPPSGSGLRGTQNAANLEAIIANKKANAVEPVPTIAKATSHKGTPIPPRPASMGPAPAKVEKPMDRALREHGELLRAADSAGVKDLHGQMQEVFGSKGSIFSGSPEAVARARAAMPDVKPFTPAEYEAYKAQVTKAPEVPHQMTPQGQVDRYVNRMVAAGSNKSPEALKAEFAAKTAAKPAGRGRKALSLLAPIAVGTAMLAASNQAARAGADVRGQSKEAAKAGVESGAVMAGFSIGAGVAMKGLMRVGVSALKAAPMVQGAFMAYGAISEGIHAYKEGGGVKDIAKGAVKGAWDMSLPGMVVNTAKDATAAISERRDLAATPHVAGMQRFNKVAADYKAKAEAARSPIVAPVEPSDGDNRARGWANAKVQAAAQAAKGRQFSGVFKDGHLQ